MDNIIESKIDADILNDVKKFLLMYFKIAGVALVVLFFVIFVKSFIMSVMLEGILLYAIWITALWLIYKYFRKNKRMLNYFSLIVLTLPYGLIMVSCRTKLKEVDKNNKKKYISEYIS